MQKYTADQFIKLYGEKAYENIGGAKPSGRPSIKDVIGKSFNSSIDYAKQGIQQVGNGSSPLDLIEGVGKVGSGVIGAAFSPVAPVVEPTVGNATKFVADKVSDIPAVQRFAESKAGEATARVAEDVANYSNIAAATGGAMEIPETLTAIKTRIANTADTIASGAKSAFDSVIDNTSKYPAKIAEKITIGKIEPKVQTILKETPSNLFDEYVSVGEKALKDPRELTPLEVAGSKAENVAKSIKEDLKTIGEQKSAALDSVKNTRVPDIATEQIDKIKPLLQKKLTSAERSTVNEYLSELKSLGKNPIAKSVDSTIDKLQATLYEKSKGVAVPMTTRVKAFINQSIGELNSKLKTAVDTALGDNTYSKLNSLYSERVQLFQTLNKALGEAGAKGGSLMKRFFSPQDAGIKKLFASIKDTYGVDLGKNATIAKFVMDTLGDTRAKSLLQLPPTTTMGIAGKALDYVEKKLTSPKQTIKKARTLTKP